MVVGCFHLDERVVEALQPLGTLLGEAPGRDVRDDRIQEAAPFDLDRAARHLHVAHLSRGKSVAEPEQVPLPIVRAERKSQSSWVNHA